MRQSKEDTELALTEAETYIMLANPEKIDPFIERVCNALLDARDEIVDMAINYNGG